MQSGQSRRSGRVWSGKNWESLWKGGHGTLRTVKGGHWGVRGTYQTEETCQLTLGSGDTKLKRHVKQGHLTLCFKVLRRLPKNHGVFTLVSTFPCETNNVADRELLAGNYIFTQSKKCKCIAQNFSTNQQPLSILKLVSCLVSL